MGNAAPDSPPTLDLRKEFDLDSPTFQLLSWIDLFRDWKRQAHVKVSGAALAAITTLPKNPAPTIPKNTWVINPLR